MKLTFTFLFSLVLCTLLSAQHNFRTPSFYYLSGENRPERMIRSVTKNGLWVDSAKHEFLYNQYDFTTCGYTKNTITSQWEDDFTLVQTYNEQGNIVGEVKNNYDNNSDSWIGEWTSVYLYNEDHSLKQYRYLEMNESNTSWDFVSQKEYKHYTNGDSVVIKEFLWNTTGAKWDSVLRTTKVFKVNGKDSVDYVCSWDTTGEKWTFSHRNWYSYYDDGSYAIRKMVLEPSGIYRIVFNTDIGYHNGLFVSKTFSRYNGTQEFLFLTQFRNFYDESDRLSYQYEEVYDTTAHLWIPVIMDQYLYPPATAVTDGESGDQLFIYPNPAKDHLNLNIPVAGDAVFSLFDLSGARVLQQPIRNNHLIDVESLSRGIYVYELKSGQKLRRGKIVLE